MKDLSNKTSNSSCEINLHKQKEVPLSHEKSQTKSSLKVRVAPIKKDINSKTNLHANDADEKYTSRGVNILHHQSSLDEQANGFCDDEKYNLVSMNINESADGISHENGKPHKISSKLKSEKIKRFQSSATPILVEASTLSCSHPASMSTASSFPQ